MTTRSNSEINKGFTVQATSNSGDESNNTLVSFTTRYDSFGGEEIKLDGEWEVGLHGIIYSKDLVTFTLDETNNLTAWLKIEFFSPQCLTHGPYWDEYTTHKAQQKDPIPTHFNYSCPLQYLEYKQYYSAADIIADMRLALKKSFIPFFRTNNGVEEFSTFILNFIFNVSLDTEKQKLRFSSMYENLSADDRGVISYNFIKLWHKLKNQRVASMQHYHPPFAIRIIMSQPLLDNIGVFPTQEGYDDSLELPNTFPDMTQYQKKNARTIMTLPLASIHYARNMDTHKTKDFENTAPFFRGYSVYFAPRTAYYGATEKDNEEKLGSEIRQKWMCKNHKEYLKIYGQWEKKEGLWNERNRPIYYPVSMFKSLYSSFVTRNPLAYPSTINVLLEGGIIANVPVGGGTKAGILATFAIDKIVGTYAANYQPPIILYHSLKVHAISSLKIRLVDEAYKLIPIRSGTVTIVTLHFRPKHA